MRGLTFIEVLIIVAIVVILVVIIAPELLGFTGE